MKLINIANLPESKDFTIEGETGVWRIYSARESSFWCGRVDDNKELIHGSGVAFPFETKVEIV
jgi:hypothetical protein